jgi:hypothetical protein
MNAIQAQAIQFQPGKSQPTEPLLKFPTEDGSRIPSSVHKRYMSWSRNVFSAARPGVF